MVEMSARAVAPVLLSALLLIAIVAAPAAAVSRALTGAEPVSAHPAPGSPGMGGLPQAVPASYGVVFNGSIDQPAEEDDYLIPAAEGDRILIRLWGSWGGFPQIRVLQPNGSALPDGRIHGISDVELTIVAPASATYHVLVSDYFEATGPYCLYMQRLNNPSGAVPLASEQTINSSIERPSEFDTYTITPAANTSALVRIHTQWGGFPEIRVFKPDGTLLTSQSGISDVEVTPVAPANGPYTVLVGDSHAVATGWYTVYAHYVPASEPPVLAVLPGGAGIPTDTDADGLYDDANGNGRADFNDVVLYFNQLSWITANEPIAYFDYNGNGRIDFADVVWLFTHI